MKKPVLLLAACVGSLHAFSQTTCATAVPIELGTYTVLAIGPSEIPFPICATGGNGVQLSGSVWFSYTPALDTTVMVSTSLAQNVGLDTRFHVYTGICGALTCYSGNDDSGGGLLSTATFDVIHGTTYLIAFDNAWTSSGFDFTLTGVLPPPPPPEGEVTFTGVATGVGGNVLAVVDMNNDALDDVVGVESTVISIGHQLSTGGFAPENITVAPVQHLASWSMSAGDIDGNGYNDLQYGAGGGVSYMMANNDGTAFTEVSFPQYVFSQRGNMVDINNDGNLDAYMCHDVDANVYYLNDGTGTLVSHQGELGTTCGNYGSIWVDYDGDGDQDLFVAKCGCDPVDIFMRNNGDGTFTSVSATLGFADAHQSWSSAWGDYDNDGDMDVLVGSSSSNIHKLMRNNGDGTFTNVTAGSGFDTFTGQGIEWNTRDFNNDGFLDIIGGYAIHYGHGDLTFSADGTAPYNGPIGDLNNDGFLDIMSGSTAMMNGGNDNNWLAINTIGTLSNNNGIGARVSITSALGTQIRDVRSGDGFRYMSSLKTYFGLGADTVVDAITVHWPSGQVSVVNDPPINGTITITEETPTSVGSINGTDHFGLYPNPATDEVVITGVEVAATEPVLIHDATGRTVMTTTVHNSRVNVSSLIPGIYVMQVNVKGQPMISTFVKK